MCVRESEAVCDIEREDDREMERDSDRDGVTLSEYVCDTVTLFVSDDEAVRVTVGSII